MFSVNGMLNYFEIILLTKTGGLSEWKKWANLYKTPDQPNRNSSNFTENMYMFQKYFNYYLYRIR